MDNGEEAKIIMRYFEMAKENLSLKRDNDCLKRVIHNQSKKVDSFKKVFWRLYFK